MRIAARSQSQAMDWSLALASQGIEPIIDCAADGQWALVVPRQHSEAAFRTLRQYHLENRRWPWRREVVHSGLLFDWGSLAWMLLIVFFYVVEQHAHLRAAGMMDSALVGAGQWWRLFTAVWLHADVGHLAANASLGVVLLGLAMGRYGTGVGLLAAYLGGFAGNLAGWMLATDGPHRSLGASGLVMAALGLVAAQSWDMWKEASGRIKVAVGAALAAVAIFLLVGVGPRTDIIAHSGGFVGGMFLGLCIVPLRKLPEIAWAQLCAGVIFTALTIAPWTALLLHAGMRIK